MKVLPYPAGTLCTHQPDYHLSVAIASALGSKTGIENSRDIHGVAKMPIPGISHYTLTHIRALLTRRDTYRHAVGRGRTSSVSLKEHYHSPVIKYQVLKFVRSVRQIWT